MSKECNNIKRDKQELESVNEELRRELEQLKSLDLTQLHGAESIRAYAQSSIDQDIPEKDTNANAECLDTNDITDVARTTNLQDHVEVDLTSSDKLMNDEHRPFKPIDLKHECRKRGSSSNRCDGLNITTLPSPEHERAEQKVAMLQLKLDEATKTIQAERE